MPIAGLGLIGLVGAAVASVAALEQQRPQLRRRPRRQLRAVRQPRALHRRHADAAVLGRLVERERLPAGEYYALMLFAICGMMLMAAATDLLVIFLALEVLSLAVYVLTGIRREQRRRRRGGVQVLPARRVLERVLPLRHRVHLRADRQHAARPDRQALSRRRRRRPTPMALLAVGLLAVGFAFKVSAVPFHMWTPDAYEGAPTIVTGVHVDRRQGGGVRRVRPRVPLGARAAQGRVDPDARR